MNYRKKGLSIALITGLTLGCTTPISATPFDFLAGKAGPIMATVAGASGPIMALYVAAKLVENGCRIGVGESVFLFASGLIISYLANPSRQLLEKMGFQCDRYNFSTQLEFFKLGLVSVIGITALCNAANVIGNDPNL